MRTKLKSPFPLLGLGLVLALMAAVACGTAAPPQDVTAPEPEVIVQEKIVEKEVIKEVPKEIIKNVVVTPTPIPASESGTVVTKVDRVIYGFGEVQETNRHWTVGRPSYYQFDPWGETLLDLEATTNNRIPRIAESWERSEDATSWTFHLVEGVPFHDDMAKSRLKT